MLMMYTRAAFYATEPSNAAAYAPVEACGAHEWSYIAHGWRAVSAASGPESDASAHGQEGGSWQQTMRARLGIDKTKSWADWAEEEEEEATLAKTIKAATAEQLKPPLLLSMRLRGGAAEGESGQESGEESGDEGGRDADASGGTFSSDGRPNCVTRVRGTFSSDGRPNCVTDLLT